MNGRLQRNMVESWGEKVDDVRLFKTQFKSEIEEWKDMGKMLCLSDRVEVVQDSDWWLDYCFNLLFKTLRRLGNCITLGHLFQDRGQQMLARLKKDDDYRPPVAIPDFELESSVWQTWDYRTCDLYLYRKTEKRGKHGTGWNTFKAEVSDFQTRAADQFEKLKSDKYKDMRLSIGEHVFLVDSYMISTQSNRFRRHLFQTRGGSAGSLEINDLTPTELEALLVYIYCRTWPTYVMEVCGRTRRPAKRFLEVLRTYGVSLSIDKGRIVKGLPGGTGSWEREEFLVDTYLDAFYSNRNCNEKYTTDNDDKHNYNSKDECNRYESLNVKIKSSRWNFDFSEGFRYNSSLSNISNKIEQDEDLRVKQEQGRKLLLEDQIHYCPRNVKTMLTSEWVVKQLQDF